MPKMYPRGGGPWDQDPILMRDFRTIRKFEIEWKNAEHSAGAESGQESAPGGKGDLEQMLDEYIENEDL